MAAEMEIELIGVTPKSFLGIALLVAIEFGWSIESITEDEISFGIKSMMPGAAELLSIKIVGNMAMLKNKSLSILSSFNLLSNSKNISKFTQAYAKKIDLNKVEEFENRFEKALELWDNKQ
jgi:hypothetical protein